MKVHKKHKVMKKEIVKKHKHSKRLEHKHKTSHQKSKQERTTLHILKNKTHSHQSYKKLAPHQVHGQENQINAFKKATENKGDTETNYSIEVDGAKVTVEIKKLDENYIYNLNVPKFSVGTESLLRYVKNELISSATINLQELSEQDSFVKMKQRFMGEILTILKEKLPHLEPDTEKTLAGMLMQDMLGLGEIEFLINDPNLEEIVIQSSKEPIRVYSKKYGWLKTNILIPPSDQQSIAA
jgi:hypothetical protein